MKTVYINEKSKITNRKIRKIAKKVDKINNKEEVAVAICDGLAQNEELIDELKSYKITVLNGKWLFKFLLYEALLYEVEFRNLQMEMASVSILINKADDTIVSQISEIAKNIKSLKIVTDNINCFLPLEEVLYCDFGIAVQVTNNKEKAISSEEIIINFDFNKEQLEKYKLPKDGTIINIKNPIEIISHKFKGTIINDYRIKYNEDVISKVESKKSFDDKVLYESLIYRRDTYTNIKKQLNNDGVKIIDLIRT